MLAELSNISLPSVEPLGVSSRGIGSNWKSSGVPPDQDESQSVSNSMIYLQIPRMGGMLPNMGRMSMDDQSSLPDLPSLGIARSLFSEVQLKVLALLFGQPGRAFQMSELISLVGSGVGAVHRVVKRFVKSGLVNESVMGKTKFYLANADSPVFTELHGLVMKTVGLTIPLQSALASCIESVYSAFIYGSVARSADHASSDIDIMIIGENLSYTDILNATQSVEVQTGRTVNVKILSQQEWKKKLLDRNPFIERILNQPMIFLKGSDHDIREP